MSLCSQCGMTIQKGFRFCNACGAAANSSEKMRSEKLYSPLMAPAGSSVRLMTGPEMGRYIAIFPELRLGREESDLALSHDQALSPSHARLFFHGNELSIEDQQSLNGVYLRVSEHALLRDNDIIRAGKHYFLYTVYPEQAFEDALDSRFYASPRRNVRFRLTELLEGGRRGSAMTAADEELRVGREDGDMVFPEDECMAPAHFGLRWTARGTMLTDFDTQNGTYIQIRERMRLGAGSMFFAGNTLFCIVS